MSRIVDLYLNCTQERSSLIRIWICEVECKIEVPDYLEWAVFSLERKNLIFDTS